jgi:hypothetical protein
MCMIEIPQGNELIGLLRNWAGAASRQVCLRNHQRDCARVLVPAAATTRRWACGGAGVKLDRLGETNTTHRMDQLAVLHTIGLRTCHCGLGLIVLGLAGSGQAR